MYKEYTKINGSEIEYGVLNIIKFKASKDNMYRPNFSYGKSVNMFNGCDCNLMIERGNSIYFEDNIDILNSEVLIPMKAIFQVDSEVRCRCCSFKGVNWILRRCDDKTFVFLCYNCIRVWINRYKENEIEYLLYVCNTN